MLVLRRSFLLALLVCVGCSAQSSSSGAAVPTEMSDRIERQVRSEFSIPQEIKLTVGERKSGDMGSFDIVEVTLEGKGEKATHEFLVSKDGNTLARLTKWDISASKFAAEEAAATQAREEAMKKIDLTGRPVAGNKNAKVTIVNYDDFQCPFCSRAHSTLFDNIIKQYGDHIKIVYKDYPLTEIHPWATRAAVNANCLGALNNDSYWAFANYVHANQKAIDGSDRRAVDAQKARLDGIARQIGTEHKVDMEKLNACIEKSDATAVMASAEEGNAVGVESTPTLFVNGEKLVGAVPPAALKRVIDKALTAAGVTPPEKPAVAETTVIPKNPNN